MGLPAETSASLFDCKWNAGLPALHTPPKPAKILQFKPAKTLPPAIASFAPRAGSLVARRAKALMRKSSECVIMYR